MANDTLPAVASTGALEARPQYSPAEIETIKQTHFKGLEEHQITYALKKAERMGLDFFRGQVQAWPGREGRVEVYTTIQGLRSKAESTGMYFPGREPSYVYDGNGHLVSCTAYVKRWDDREKIWVEISSTAMMAEYGLNRGAWQTHKHAMLAKCAEATALRRAFAQLADLYISEERESGFDSPERKGQDRASARAEKISRITPAGPAPEEPSVPQMADSANVAGMTADGMYILTGERFAGANFGWTALTAEQQQQARTMGLAPDQTGLAEQEKPAPAPIGAPHAKLAEELAGLSKAKKTVLFRRLGLSDPLKLDELTAAMVDKILADIKVVRGGA